MIDMNAQLIRVTLSAMKDGRIPEAIKLARSCGPDAMRSLLLSGEMAEDVIAALSNRMRIVYWNLAVKHNKLSERFLLLYSRCLNWDLVCVHQTLSEEFMRENPKLIRWSSVSCHQKMSEPFIHEFKDQIDWTNLISFQADTLSDEFVQKHKSLIDWSALKFCPIDGETRARFRWELESAVFRADSYIHAVNLTGVRR